MRAWLVLAVSFSRAAPQPVHSSLGGRPLSGRTKLASVLSLLLVPLTIFIGIVYFGKKSYGVVSILVLLECMAPFALIFEGRKPKARELVLIAALCALARCRTRRAFHAAGVQAGRRAGDFIWASPSAARRVFWSAQ